MADRHEERYARDPYTSGRGFARHDRNILERAGDEVRSWFGRDEAERGRRMDEHERDRYQSMHGYGYAGDREEYRSHRDYGSMPDRRPERDWTPDRWERSDRWSGQRPSAYGPAAAPSRTWQDRDDRYVAPADYDTWTRQGLGWTPGRQTESRGIYEDDRGRVHQFEHGQDNYAGRGPKGYRRSDERIHEDICERLTDDWRIDASDMEIAVNNGEVTLQGVVNSRAAKRHAEDLVEEISGVRDVHNNLRVSTSR